MKKYIIIKCLNSVKNDNPNITSEKLAEVKYGLEGLYLSITKVIIIFIIAYFLNIMKQTLIIMFTYNIIRSTSFGLHATKSIYCLISSIFIFIGGVYICEYIYVPIYLKVLLSIISIYILYKYAPADTHRRPIVNMKKRRIYKIISVLIGFIYLILIVTFRDNIISKYLLVGMLEACILIHPLTYKIFNLPYDNYKSYVKQQV